MTDETNTGSDAVDLDKLEALARAAINPLGSWYRKSYIQDGIRDEEDASYLAALDPAIILSLIAQARAAAPAATSQAPNEWAEAQRICDLPAVDEAIRGLLEDSTGDNATCLVREVMRALSQQPVQAAGDEPARAALRKLCDQLEGMKHTMFLMPGTGQHYSYWLREDASFYVEEARKFLAAPTAKAEPVAWIAYYDGVKSQNVARTAEEKANIEEIGRLMNPAAQLTWEALYAAPVAPQVAPLTDARILEIRNTVGEHYNSAAHVSDSGACEFARAIEREVSAGSAASAVDAETVCQMAEYIVDGAVENHYDSNGPDYRACTCCGNEVQIDAFQKPKHGQELTHKGDCLFVKAQGIIAAIAATQEKK